MNPSDAELKRIWLDVIDEYHATPLAALGYRYPPAPARFTELRQVVRNVPEGGTLVDIGVGMAIFARVLKRLGARVISIDPPSTGPEARANAELVGIETHVCDVIHQALPIADGSVDCILFADVIEHLMNSPLPALREFRRVLKPGGTCVATTCNAVRLPVRIKLLMGYSNWPPLTDFYDQPVHQGHHHEYTPEEFRMAFESAGFSVAELLLHGTTADVATISFDRMAGVPKSEAGGGNPVIGIGKRLVGAIEQLVPRLRRDMLLVART